MMIDRSIALFGTTEPVPERTVLRAGPVTVTLEDGALRWVRFGDIEVLRTVAFLVRDRNWGTPVPEISDLKIKQAADTFRVTFKALCRTDEGDLPWSAEITGAADGALRFVGTANPSKDFVTNRTGFVVLHPLAGVVGAPVEITTVDSATRATRFPEFVDPEPCFTDVRAMSHEVLPGVRATCTMEGDAWETEDHRNWTDASFKTYVRPLSQPYPYTLAGGATVTQSVSLSFTGSGDVSAAAAAKDERITVMLGRETGTRMPAIGLRAPVRWLDEAANVGDLAGQIGPQLVSARIDLRAGYGAELLRRFGTLADMAGAGLALELVVPSERDPATELGEFAGILAASGVRPESIMVSPPENRLRLDPGPPVPPLTLLAALHVAARRAFPDIPIGGGVFGHFTELNRNWPPAGLVDFIGHVSCSLVHASDDRTVMENLESFRHIARTVRAVAGGLPYRLVATGIAADTYLEGPPIPNPENKRMTMARMDPRHRGLLGAARVLATIGEAARGGLAAVAPAAFVGEFGVVHRRLDYAQPWFDERDGPFVYPVFHPVAGMAKLAGQATVETISSDESRIAAVACRTAVGGSTLWLANLTDSAQEVALVGAGGPVTILDESTFEAAAGDPDFMRNSSSAETRSNFAIGAYGVATTTIGETK